MLELEVRDQVPIRCGKKCIVDRRPHRLPAFRPIDKIVANVRLGMQRDRRPVRIGPPATRHPARCRNAAGHDHELLELEIRHQVPIRHGRKSKVDCATHGLATFCPIHKIKTNVRLGMQHDRRPVRIGPPATRLSTSGRSAAGCDRDLLEFKIRDQVPIRCDGKRKVGRSAHGLAGGRPIHKVVARIRLGMQRDRRPIGIGPPATRLSTSGRHAAGYNRVLLEFKIRDQVPIRCGEQRVVDRRPHGLAVFRPTDKVVTVICRGMQRDGCLIGIGPPAARRPTSGRHTAGRDRELLHLEIRHQVPIRCGGKRIVDRAPHGLAVFRPIDKVVADIRRRMDGDRRPEREGPTAARLPSRLQKAAGRNLDLLDLEIRDQVPIRCRRKCKVGRSAHGLAGGRPIHKVVARIRLGMQRDHRPVREDPIAARRPTR